MFDGAEFSHRSPNRRPAGETARLIAIVALAIIVLVMPISLNALVDLIRYARGH